MLPVVGLFYIVPDPEQQVELNVKLRSNQTEWHLYFYYFYFFNFFFPSLEAFNILEFECLQNKAAGLQ